MAIPVVDLAQFSGAAPQKAAFVSALGKAYEDVGFVAVKNHGISETTIKGLYQNTTTFFSLPQATKNNYEMPGLAGQRGYTSFGKEHAKGSTAPDLRNSFSSAKRSATVIRSNPNTPTMLPSGSCPNSTPSSGRPIVPSSNPADCC
jgi:isopenicillin N synthase-like dioxygenase